MSSAIPTPSTTTPSTTAPTQRRRTFLAAAVGTAAGIGLLAGGLSPAAAHAAEATTASGTVAEKSAEQAAERTYSSPVPAGAGAPTSVFGPRGDSFHLGTDYGVATGTPITAVTDGEVLRVETGKKVGDTSPRSALKHHTGNGVVVKHGEISGDEMYSYYGHLSAVDVKPGDKVKAGSVVGKAGNTGNSTGPHLHFGVMVNSDEPNCAKWKSATNTGFIDPHDWLKRKGVNAGSDAPVTP